MFQENPLFYKLDPRIKILLSIIYIIDLFLVNSFKGIFFIIGFTLTAIIVSKVPFHIYIKV
jgi:energy-coupling factor transport system permease protein